MIPDMRRTRLATALGVVLVGVGALVMWRVVAEDAPRTSPDTSVVVDARTTPTTRLRKADVRPALKIVVPRIAKC